MPTTTNFGWTTPADTDLVKDGASAMRTLAGGIDTSMAQLKGGTTGQILSKTSNTDMAFTWINNDQGDLTAITAGTGISVTSGTGPIPTVAIDTATTVDKTTAQTLTNKTLTAPVISTISNTGTLTLPTSTDTLVGRATTDTLTNKTISGSSNTISNVSLTTGVTGTLPIANGGTGSTTATAAANAILPSQTSNSGKYLTTDGTNTSWGSISTTPSFVGCRAYSTSNTTLSNSTWTAITWNSETYDTDGFHSTSSNTSRITIPTGKGGYYRFWGNGAVNTASTTLGARYICFYKNGVQIDQPFISMGAVEYPSSTITATINLAAGDYVEMYMMQSTGSSQTSLSAWMEFGAQYLGA